MNGKMRAFILVTVLAALGFVIYDDVLRGLIASVLDRGESSHGFCVPFISGYLVWLRSEKIKKITPEFAPVPGMAMAGVGLLIFYLLGKSSTVAFAALSFLLVAAGLVVCLFGKDSVSYTHLTLPTILLV